MDNKNQNNQKPGLSWTQPASAPQTKIHEQPQKNQTAQTPTNESSNSKVVWIVGAVVVCVIAALIFIGQRDKSGSTGSNATTTATKTERKTDATEPTTVTPVVGSMEGLTVPSPQDAGMEVLVEVESVPAPTWIVVYENNNGKPGNVLGAAFFTQTISSDSISLLRGTQPGRTYFVGKTHDDGDRKYALDVDPVVRDDEGNPVLVEFTTR